jgi:hypothetical protein
MKLPTSNGNDLYQIGNDYPQEVDKYFVSGSYHDGIYTELKKDITSAEVYSAVSSLDGFDDTFFPPKNPFGLNKRILNVSQKLWDAPQASADYIGTEDDISAISAVSATFSPDYAVGELSAF